MLSRSEGGCWEEERNNNKEDDVETAIKMTDDAGMEERLDNIHMKQATR